LTWRTHERDKVLIADYDFGDVNIEREIIEAAGFEVVAAQCKSEDEVAALGRDADGVLAQYAPVGKRPSKPSSAAG
jgi:D-3-phosphoglycerate dehydrogenase